MTPAQADKDAANQVCVNMRLSSHHPADVIARAIAEAREQGRREMQAECSKVADTMYAEYQWNPQWSAVGHRIAEAIRALK